MPDEATTKYLLQFLMTFLGGGLVGTILGHFLAIGRDARNRKHASEVDRQARKTSFLAFLNVWEAEVDRNLGIVSPVNVSVEQFDAKRYQLIEKATELELSYRDKTGFRWAYKTIVDMTAGEVGGERGKQKLFQAIHNLAVFVRKD
jgi:argininosuccinate lyase